MQQIKSKNRRKNVQKQYRKHWVLQQMGLFGFSAPSSARPYPHHSLKVLKVCNLPLENQSPSHFVHWIPTHVQLYFWCAEIKYFTPESLVSNEEFFLQDTVSVYSFLTKSISMEATIQSWHSQWQFIIIIKWIVLSCSMLCWVFSSFSLVCLGNGGNSARCWPRYMGMEQRRFLWDTNKIHLMHDSGSHVRIWSILKRTQKADHNEQ